MQFVKYLVIAIFCGMVFPLFSQNPSANPLLVHSNSPIAFDKVDARTIREAVAQIIDLSNKRVDKIVTGIKPGSGSGGILAAYDLMTYDLNDLSVKLGLISQTYTDDSSRNAANEGSQMLSDYQTSLILNVAFYQAFKKYADVSLPSLKPNQKKYVREQVRLFENNGMKLDSSGRKRLQSISDKMITLGIAFDRNIGMYSDSIIFSEKDLENIPENQKKAWRRQVGLYVVYVNTPNLTEIVEHAASNDTRKLMLTRYLNRAYPQNIKVLDSLLYYRQ